VPLDRNPCFTRRASTLKQIRQALTAEGIAGLTQVQAITGLGGVDKTQTALEYAYRYYWDVNRPDHFAGARLATTEPDSIAVIRCLGS